NFPFFPIFKFPQTLPFFQSKISILLLKSHVFFSSSLFLFSPLLSLISFLSPFPLPFHCHYIKTHLHHLSQSNSSSVLLSCHNQNTLKRIHHLSNGFRGTSNFSDLESAISEFDSISKSDTFAWNSFIKAHVDSGMLDAALGLYRKMQESCVLPDNFTLAIVNRAISALPGCLRHGEKNHCLGIQMGFGSDVYFCNTLIGMYGRCGRIDYARKVFDEMSQRDLVSWTSMISGYVRFGNFHDSFQVFREMRMAEFEPNSVTLVTMLQACSIIGNVVHGRQFHGYGIRKGFESYEIVRNSILTMYTKTGSFKDAESLFGMTEMPDVVSWNIMISGYSSKGDLLKVAESFNVMMRLEVIPSIETLTLLISASTKLGNFLLGKIIHSYAVKKGLNDVFLQTSLVDFYAKCGDLGISTQLFEEIQEKNSISWSVMMSGFIQQGYYKEAIELFRRMQVSNLKLTVDILRGLVLTYIHLGALQLGKGVHGYVIRNRLYGVEDNTSMETSFLNMYAKCGNIVSARKCFDGMEVKDVVSWTSMIDGYGIHGFGLEALEHFDAMVSEGVEPNNITFLSLLSACSHSGLVNEGYRVLDLMSSRFGIKPDLNHYTCLVDLLGRSGKLEEALRVIENMTVEPDSRIWGALLASCRIHSNAELGAYAARRVFDLEPKNAGYHIVLSNVHARGERWGESENVRTMMCGKDLKKKPGWSCIEVGGGLHGFVVGDSSHPQAIEIYRILGCLAKNMDEGG
ncbi:putative pentatricopeptide repeat-containing protein At3g01580, partial [Magnolia sinica]|uniref:putative pentatricopeptide repeat-containing protein At3g01580 n=1 Tax=Magnolia sinica TaxID=86752 RepID=UPI0026598F08